MADMNREGETQLVVFRLEDEEFACNINDVREVLKMVRVTPLPRSLDFVEGVINLRGEVIPVIDLRKRFGLEKTEITSDSRIIIVEVKERMVGLIVDSVSEVNRLINEEIQDAPDQVAGRQTNLIMGVGKIDERLLIILNLDRILSSEERAALDGATGDEQELLTS